MSGFNGQAYLQNKLNQLNNDPAAKQAAAALGWTGGSVDDLRAFMAKGGMTPEQHYQQHGIREGLNAVAPAPAPAYVPPAPAPAPAAQPKKSQWQSDWEGFFSDAIKPGTVTNVGSGGKVTKMHDGTAVYQDSTGAWITFDRNTNPGDLARRATQLGIDWATRYRTDSLAPTGPYAGNSRIDPASQGFIVNADGTVTRRGVNPNIRAGETGGDFTTSHSLNDIKDPQVRAYYEANLDQFFADSAIFKDGMYRNAIVGRNGVNTYANAPFEEIYKNRYFSGETAGMNIPWEDRVLEIPYGQGLGKTPREIMDLVNRGMFDRLHPYYQELIRTGRFGPNMNQPVGAVNGRPSSGGNSGGIILNAISGGSANGGTSGGSSSSGGSSGFTPWIVTPDQTVEGRLPGLIRSDNPLMQQARSRAMLAMNERGLINSSMAAQAAQDAVLERALQIAQPDAQTNARAGEFNASQRNAWELAGRELGMKQGMFDRELQFKYDQLKQDAANREALTEIEFKYRQLLAQDEAFNEQYRMYVEALYQIDKDTNLSAEAKQAAKYQQARMLEDYARLRGLNLNLDFSDRFKPSAAPAAAPAPSPASPPSWQPGGGA